MTAIRYQALDHVFEVDGSPEAGLDGVLHLVAPLASSTAPDVRTVAYEVRRAGQMFEVRCDAEVLLRSHTVDKMVDGFYGHINAEAIRSVQATHVALHAGAVERDGAVLVLPGASGAGKTTLTAALMQAGWSYLTDEIVAIDLDDLSVRRYPKCLRMTQTSVALLLGAADAGSLFASTEATKVPVPPGCFGSLATSDPGGNPRWIVVPERADAPAESVPLGAPETVAELSRHVFPGSAQVKAQLLALARAVTESHASYRCAYPDARSAAGRLENLLA